MRLTDLQRDLNAYLAAVRIETDGNPAPFSEVADPWQLQAIDAIAPAITRLVNTKAPKPTMQRAWWVRPRGHAKTADAAMLIAWVLAFSRRRRRGVWIASDKEQGCEGLDAIATLCRHNPWLNKLLTIRSDKVENTRTRSVLRFTTSDVGSAFGWKDHDIFCFDEVTHWPLKGGDLWTAVYSAAGKRKDAVVFALMNAGFSGSFQERLRNTAEVDSNWAFSELPDAIASWISPEQLEDQRKYLPEVAWNRLWRNRWSASGGDVLSPSDIERAFDDRLRPMAGREQGWLFVTGCDLGLTRDFSSVITLAIPDATSQRRFDKIRLADARLWRPPTNRKLDLLEIQRYILTLDERFGLEHVVIDSWQAEHLAQVLENDSGHRRRNQRRRFDRQPWVRTIQPTGAILRDLANLTIESFVDFRLRMFSYEPLKRDLLALRAEERPFGIRLVSPRNAASGHGDSYSAFVLALLVGHELSAKRRVVAGVASNTPGGLSPFQREWQLREQEYEAERRMLSEPNDDQEEFKDLMRRVGRLR